MQPFIPDQLWLIVATYLGEEALILAGALEYYDDLAAACYDIAEDHYLARLEMELENPDIFC